MLTDLCQELRNWFDCERHYGHFTIQNGVLDVDFLAEGQYYRIIGSVFNDGVYNTSDTLDDEEFDGAVWALAIPKAVLALNNDIDAWNDKYGGVNGSAMSPFMSESYGGYSYSKGSGNTSQGSTSINWQTVFASRLNRWRKI